MQSHPFQVIAYHSCEVSVGLDVLNGKMELKPSENTWDWLGHGVYFWEDNPARALEYAFEVSKGTQKNKKKISEPFVLGAIIQLGNCLNLIEPSSLDVVASAYNNLRDSLANIETPLPKNKGSNRALDCAVIQYVHQINKTKDLPAYDTVRCAFTEGTEIYPTANFTARGHIEICVRNSENIKAFFLPRPIKKFNPHFDI